MFLRNTLTTRDPNRMLHSKTSIMLQKQPSPTMISKRRCVFFKKSSTPNSNKARKATGVSRLLSRWLKSRFIKFVFFDLFEILLIWSISGSIWSHVGTLQEIAHLHQVCRYEELRWKVDQLYFGLCVNVEAHRLTFAVLSDYSGGVGCKTHSIIYLSYMITFRLHATTVSGSRQTSNWANFTSINTSLTSWKRSWSNCGLLAR